MNVPRGYRRLAIATVGSWIVGCAVVGGYAAWVQDGWSDIFIEASRGGHMAEMTYASQQSREAGELVGKAIAWGMLAIPIAFAFALGWWVYRGFVPSDRED